MTPHVSPPAEFALIEGEEVPSRGFVERDVGGGFAQLSYTVEE